MSSYVYRGVGYTKSNVVVDVNRQTALMYRGVSYTKKDPILVSLDKSRICYRGFRLAGLTAPEPTRLDSLFDAFGDFKLAH